MKVNLFSKTIIGTALALFPKEMKPENPSAFLIPPTIISQPVSLDSSFVANLKDTFVTNFRGGVSHCYTDSSLEVLRKRILSKNLAKKYFPPVDTLLKPYIGNLGQFGSPRPNGRPHIGVDIYTTTYGRKPLKPVPIHPTINGIVISTKKAREKDNLIANHVAIMGTDGKIYSFDHLAKGSDYPKNKEVPLKPLGTIVTPQDTLGYMGATGETSLWHLHFSVRDLDTKKKQELNPTWKKLYKDNKDYSKPDGQVNPLDSAKAGPIANTLHKYEIQKGQILAIAKEL